MSVRTLRRHQFRFDPARHGGRTRRVLFAASLAILFVLVGLGGGTRPASADDKPTLKIDPATQSVTPCQVFTINIIQSATTATTGAQVNITYDPAQLHP